MSQASATILFLGLTMAAQGAPRHPVLVELFTSEGCSSCPPADALLEALDKSQPVPGAEILVLSEHVDYWNHDAYRDPFSSPQATTRQRAYASRFHLEDVYTPQMVVDGAAEALGNDKSAALKAVEHASAAEKLDVALTLLPDGRVKLAIEPLPPAYQVDGAGVFLAIADNEDSSDVRGGENDGRHLHHVAVVRSLTSVGKVSAHAGFTKELSLGKHNENSRVIAFVQEPKQGRIIGSALVSTH